MPLQSQHEANALIFDDVCAQQLHEQHNEEHPHHQQQQQQQIKEQQLLQQEQFDELELSFIDCEVAIGSDEVTAAAELENGQQMPFDTYHADGAVDEVTSAAAAYKTEEDGDMQLLAAAVASTSTTTSRDEEDVDERDGRMNCMMMTTTTTTMMNPHSHHPVPLRRGSSKTHTLVRGDELEFFYDDQAGLFVRTAAAAHDDDESAAVSGLHKTSSTGIENNNNNNQSSSPKTIEIELDELLRDCDNDYDDDENGSPLATPKLYFSALESRRTSRSHELLTHDIGNEPNVSRGDDSPDLGGNNNTVLKNVSGSEFEEEDEEDSVNIYTRLARVEDSLNSNISLFNRLSESIVSQIRLFAAQLECTSNEIRQLKSSIGSNNSNVNNNNNKDDNVSSTISPSPSSSSLSASSSFSSFSPSNIHERSDQSINNQQQQKQLQEQQLIQHQQSLARISSMMDSIASSFQ